MYLKPNKYLSHSICLLLLISILIQFSKGDNFSENERYKRTIGFLFRELVNAFQSPQQPASTVTSFQPQRPTKTKKRPPKPNLPPPDNPKPEKAILQSVVTTESAEVQLLPLVEPPVTAAPQLHTPTPDDSVLISQQRNTQSNFPENHPQNSLFVPTNPFEKIIPPPGHNPLMPLKAQIFFIPFQNNQELVNALPQNTEPRFNYEAEIYFQTPQNAVYPPTNHNPAARYSPSNGWYDVDEIISRTTQKGSKYTNVPHENFTHPDYRQLNYQNLEGLSPQTDSKLGTFAAHVVPSQNGHESTAQPPVRRIDHDLDQKPSFVPYQEYFGNGERGFYHRQEPHQGEDTFQYQYVQTPQQETGYLQQSQEVNINPYDNVHSRAYDFTPQSSKLQAQPYLSEYQQDSGYTRNSIVHNVYNYEDPTGYDHYPTKIGRLPAHLT